MSTSPAGLRQHLQSLSDWAAESLVRVNAEKTWGMHLGTRYIGKLFVLLNGTGVEFVPKAKYVGMTIATGNPRIFRAHYSEQQLRARRAAGLCFVVDGLTGALPVETALKVYKARVDPRLISGADVSPDAVDAYLQELETEQAAYLRRMLGLGSRSLLVPLFSETGIWLICYRRADLALRYLEYALSREHTSLVWRAAQDSMALAHLDCSSWYTDLQIAVRKCGAVLPQGMGLAEGMIAACKTAPNGTRDTCRVRIVN